MSAIVGPLVALMLVGFLARMQNFFCPANFLPLYAVSFLLLAPGFFLIGLSGAEAALHLAEREMARWQSFVVLAGTGSILGILYFESLAFVLIRVLPDYSPLFTMPGLRMSLGVAAALAATWNLVVGRSEPQALSLR
jgi:hypothetical protein